jgi:folate-binding protein YgfZ
VWPLFGVDIDTTSLPAETGLADVAVSFTKGCYPGQELVERMDSRGSTAPHLLMRLSRVANPLTNTSAVPGEKYVASGTELGVCTSVAGDFALVQVRRACLGQAEQLKTL